MLGRFSVQSREQTAQGFNKILAEGVVDDDNTVRVDKLQGWRKGVIRKYYKTIDDLLNTLSNVRYVYWHDFDDYTHYDADNP